MNVIVKTVLMFNLSSSFVCSSDDRSVSLSRRGKYFASIIPRDLHPWVVLTVIAEIEMMQNTMINALGIPPEYLINDLVFPGDR